MSTTSRLRMCLTITLLEFLIWNDCPVSVIPSDGAVEPSTVTLFWPVRSSRDRRWIVPPTAKWIRLLPPVSASRRLPGPESFRLVTQTTGYPAPPVVPLPYPSGVPGMGATPHETGPDTVTATADDVVVLPAASRATAVSV